MTRIRNIGTNFVYKRFLRRRLMYAGGREYNSVLNPFNSSERSPVKFTVLENFLHTLFDTLYLPPLFHSTLSHPMPIINSLFFLCKNWRVSCRLPISQGLLSTNKECLNSRLFRMSLGSRTFPHERFVRLHTVTTSRWGSQAFQPVSVKSLCRNWTGLRYLQHKSKLQAWHTED